jgi:hypothetical protein
MERVLGSEGWLSDLQMDVETAGGAELSVKRLVEIENGGGGMRLFVWLLFTKVVGDNGLCKDGQAGGAACASELG